MRRILAWVSILLALGAFVLMCLVLALKIDLLIPILMFAAALVLLFIVKRMPANNDGHNAETQTNVTAVYDNKDN